MSDDQRARQGSQKINHEQLCWWLFLASSVFFVIVALRDGDILSIMGAALFFAAVVVYLVGERR